METGAAPAGLVVKTSMLKITRDHGTPERLIHWIERAALMTKPALREETRVAVLEMMLN
jgi:hypothetical protein